MQHKVFIFYSTRNKKKKSVKQEQLNTFHLQCMVKEQPNFFITSYQCLQMWKWSKVACQANQLKYIFIFFNAFYILFPCTTWI